MFALWTSPNHILIKDKRKPCHLKTHLPYLTCRSIIGWMTTKVVRRAFCQEPNNLLTKCVMYLHGGETQETTKTLNPDPPQTALLSLFLSQIAREKRGEDASTREKKKIPRKDWRTLILSEKKQVWRQQLWHWVVAAQSVASGSRTGTLLLLPLQEHRWHSWLAMRRVLGRWVHWRPHILGELRSASGVPVRMGWSWRRRRLQQQQQQKQQERRRFLLRRVSASWFGRRFVLVGVEVLWEFCFERVAMQFRGGARFWSEWVSDGCHHLIADVFNVGEYGEKVEVKWREEKRNSSLDVCVSCRVSCLSYCVGHQSDS